MVYHKIKIDDHLSIPRESGENHLLQETPGNRTGNYKRDDQPTKINFISFLDFLMVDQIFLSLQVKQNVIISNKPIYTSCLTSCWTTLGFVF